MPTILRFDGLRIVIYPNDHPPAHVHVIGPDWEVVINLVGLQVREIICGGDREARRAFGLVQENQTMLMDAWRSIHG
jgi:Domain of unknown function (DUF4160)